MPGRFRGRTNGPGAAPAVEGAHARPTRPGRRRRCRPGGAGGRARARAPGPRRHRARARPRRRQLGAPLRPPEAPHPQGGRRAPGPALPRRAPRPSRAATTWSPTCARTRSASSPTCARGWRSLGWRRCPGARRGPRVGASRRAPARSRRGPWWSRPASPRRPTRRRSPAPTAFAGSLRHAADYRGPADAAGRRVLVVGAGNSGVDLALALADVAASVDLAVRDGLALVPCPTPLTPTRRDAAPGAPAGGSPRPRCGACGARTPSSACRGLPGRCAKPSRWWASGWSTRCARGACGCGRGSSASMPAGARFADGTRGALRRGVAGDGLPRRDGVGGALAGPGPRGTGGGARRRGGPGPAPGRLRLPEPDELAAGAAARRRARRARGRRSSSVGRRQ